MPLVKRAYKYRLYPNGEQRRALAQTFGCARYVYNWALDRRSAKYEATGEHLTFARLCRDLTALKKVEETAWLRAVSSVALQQSLRNLDAALTNFFAGRARYPRFKKKRGRQTARFVGDSFSVVGGGLRLSRVPGFVRVRWSRAVPTAPSSCTVSLDPSGRYHVSFLCEVESAPLPPTAKGVGIDLGLSSLVTTSHGETVPNPAHLDQTLRKLRRAQRRLCRMQKGSNGWEKQRRRVARIYAKVANQRSDYLHKLTTQLVRDYGLIACESLPVLNLIKNRPLARHIAQAGWGELVRQLKYKADWYGRTLVQVDPFFPSSKLCSGCGHTAGSLPLSTRSWECPECGARHDRDTNAAINIHRAGLARIDAGGELGKTAHGTALLAPLDEVGTSR